jgi:hypothetical protein
VIIPLIISFSVFIAVLSLTAFRYFALIRWIGFWVASSYFQVFDVMQYNYFSFTIPMLIAFVPLLVSVIWTHSICCIYVREEIGLIILR